MVDVDCDKSILEKFGPDFEKMICMMEVDRGTLAEMQICHYVNFSHMFSRNVFYIFYIFFVSFLLTGTFSVIVRSAYVFYYG